MIEKRNKLFFFKSITNENCINQCPYCGFEMSLYDCNMQRCIKCKRLKDILIENVETKVNAIIQGHINLYDFSYKKTEVIIFTSSIKKENLYLYNIELGKICWAKRIPFRPYGFCNAPLKKIIYLDDRIIAVIPSSSAEHGNSFLFSYQITTGDPIAKFEIGRKWTNAIKCKQNIIVGCRDGFIYCFDKDLNLKNKFCIKDPTIKYSSSWSIPAPFNIITDDTEKYVTFSSEANLFLFDSEVNFLWSKDVPRDFREFKFIGNTQYHQKKYSWACQVLDVDIKSTEEQIKGAFRKKALQWHPDRHKEENKKMAEEKFKEIANAYELLSNISGKELNLELERIGSLNFMIGGYIYDRIGKIDFVEEENTKLEYIRVITKGGIEKIFDLTGQCIESRQYRQIAAS